MYRSVLARVPQHPVALNALGMQALRDADFTTAIEMFGRAAAADPDAGPLWLNLATAHRSSGDDAGERAALDRALALDQRDLMANLRLAELLDRQGEPVGAIQRWQGIAQMLQGAPDRTAGLDQILDRARARLAEHAATMGSEIDAGLAAVRSAVDAPDRRRFDACVDAMLGRRAIYINECHGMRYPFLPADEFFDRRHFDWMADVEAKTDAIRAELEALVEAQHPGFRPYVELEPGTPENKWSPLDHKLDWTALYLWKYGVRDDEICERCPVTASVLDMVPRADMPGRAPTAFFSVLQPGARLPAHTGVSNVRAIVHLPLVVPPGCGFRVGGETREWKVGKAFAFDDTIEHEAWNNSDKPRSILIFDVWNPHLTAAERDMLRTLFRVTTGRDEFGQALAVAE